MTGGSMVDFRNAFALMAVGLMIRRYWLVAAGLITVTIIFLSKVTAGLT